MTENEFLLEDRIAKIKATVGKYGEENFYISFSGGKDSTVLSALVDMAVPGNKIPRVYANTGIEYKMILDFVKKKQSEEHSWELVILKPQTPIKPMLEAEGYPFKSKKHSETVASYQRNGTVKGFAMLEHYTRQNSDGVSWAPSHCCPKKLLYQFTPEFKLKVSDKCCKRLKEEPIRKWQKENNVPYTIIGLMREEGGRRESAVCLAFERGKLKAFQPLVVVSKEWEEWFIQEHNVEICDIYKPPYNSKRTGCKGCPFALNLQKELDTLEKFFPNERKQCEIIWKPVYDEYRRLGYRLKKPYENDHVEGQLAFTDIDMNIGTE